MRFEIKKYKFGGREYFVAAVSYVANYGTWEDRAVREFFVTRAFGKLADIMSALEKIYLSTEGGGAPESDLTARRLEDLGIDGGYSMWNCGNIIIIHSRENGLDGGAIHPDCDRAELESLFHMSLEEREMEEGRGPLEED